MHSRIHASISYSFKKKIITFHALSNHSSYSIKSLKIIYKKKKKKSTMIIFCVSLTNVRHTRNVCRHFKSKIQVLPFLHQDPLRGNGNWFLLSHRGPLRGNGHRSLYMKTLCKAMVIDFLCHIEALWEAMVIEFFRYRPSPRDWSNIFFKKSKYKKNMVCQIVTLYMVMVTKSFGYRPSPRDWSNIFSKKI